MKGLVTSSTDVSQPRNTPLILSYTRHFGQRCYKNSGTIVNICDAFPVELLIQNPINPDFMTAMIRSIHFPRLKFVGFFSAVAICGAQAAPTMHSIEDLKSVQSKINKVVTKVLPATVSLFSARNGASGSGVIINKGGLILTAGHVVRGAEEMTIVFPDGKQARGKVLGANYTRDSAMIQIINQPKTGSWPYAEVGTSKTLTTGDLVVALGHAGGFDPVRTPPVRFGRVITHQSNKFLSTDCALIGGDSGGPLFDLDGKVIGIHSSIGTDLSSNNHAGIEGFHQDWKKLQAGKTWGSLGGSNLGDPDSPVIGIDAADAPRGGTSILHVYPGSPASKAGLRVGDVIRTIGGRNIRNLRVLNAAIAEYKPGQSIKIRITRGKESLLRNLILGRRGDFTP